MITVKRTFMSSSSSYPGWAIVVATLVFALASAATAASRYRSTWGEILLGGENCDNSDLPARAALYDPASNDFADTTMKSPRDSAIATLIASGSDAGRVLVIGGYDKDACALASTELYDPATNSFGRGPSMHGVRVWHTATPLTAGPHAGEVLIVGGWGGPHCYDPVALISTELYDPATRSFSPGPSLHAGRQKHTATLITSGPNKGKILIAGGVDSKDNPLASTELYDPWSNQIEPGPSMNLPRVGHTATVIPAGESSGKILIAGGDSTNDYHPLATTELFDPLTNRFLAGPTMKTARESHTATVLNAGPNAEKILIAGGSNDREGLASTELYDPERNAFAPGPSMNYPRYGHTATDIGWGRSAGRILITGRNDYGSIIPSDLYDAATNTFVPAANSPLWRGGCDGTFAIQLPPRPPHDSHR
jgi:hypothetical protein